MSAAAALRISYVVFGLGAFSAVLWLVVMAFKLPFPPNLLFPMQLVGMTWPLSLYAVALYRRRQGPK
jgi:hypothetical protein